MLTAVVLVVLVVIVLVTIGIVFYCNARLKAFRKHSSAMADIWREDRNGIKLDPSRLLLDAEIEL